MPYIVKEQREKYKNVVLQIAYLKEIENKGDLEYLIAVLQLKYMQTREQKYSLLHDCVYACTHAADEFRRRYLDKREDLARKTNGDIELPKPEVPNSL